MAGGRSKLEEAIGQRKEGRSVSLTFAGPQANRSVSAEERSSSSARRSPSDGADARPSRTQAEQLDGRSGAGGGNQLARCRRDANFRERLTLHFCYVPTVATIESVAHPASAAVVAAPPTAVGSRWAG